MKKYICIVFTVLFLLAGCTVPPGQIKKQTAPGQIKKVTGEHPVSGKKK